MRFYVTEKIGPRRARTPEGFLVCYDVPIARTGEQKYGPGETPIDVGPEGLVLVAREAADIFREETLASFNGKPVTNDHPVEDVTPDNWRSLAIGTVMGPRKGSDVLMIADLLITDRHGIELVEAGKVEVSCGYDADYEETGPGQGRQKNILGNHVALVERARCGPRCSIGDHEHPEIPMSKKKFDLAGYLSRAFKAKDAAEVEAIEKEAKDAAAELSEPAGAVHVHIGSNPIPAAGTGDADPDDDEDGEDPKLKKVMDAVGKRVSDAMSEMKSAVDSISERLEKIEKQEKKEHAEDDEYSMVGDEDVAREIGAGDDDVKSVKDSARFVDAFRSTVSAAEIVAPGVKVRTFDAASPPKKTVLALHETRLDALEEASKNATTAALMSDLMGHKPFDRKRVSIRDAATMFQAVAAVSRQANNASPYRQVAKDNGQHPASKAPMTIAELNALNASRNWN